MSKKDKAMKVVLTQPVTYQSRRYKEGVEITLVKEEHFIQSRMRKLGSKKAAKEAPEKAPEKPKAKPKAKAPAKAKAKPKADAKAKDE